MPPNYNMALSGRFGNSRNPHAERLDVGFPQPISAPTAAMQLREMSPTWRAALSALDLELSEWLTKYGLTGPNVWTGLPLADDHTFMDRLWPMLEAFDWPFPQQRAYTA